VVGGTVTGVQSNKNASSKPAAAIGLHSPQTKSLLKIAKR